jgi:hypothetical protein
MPGDGQNDHRADKNRHEEEGENIPREFSIHAVLLDSDF